METSIKRLKRGDLFTVTLNETAIKANRSTLLCGDILRVVSKASPYIFIEKWDNDKKEWKRSLWEADITYHNLIRVKEEALKSPNED